jgi:hypothetical protein
MQTPEWLKPGIYGAGCGALALLKTVWLACCLHGAGSQQRGGAAGRDAETPPWRTVQLGYRAGHAANIGASLGTGRYRRLENLLSIINILSSVTIKLRATNEARMLAALGSCHGPPGCF